MEMREEVIEVSIADFDKLLDFLMVKREPWELKPEFEHPLTRNYVYFDKDRWKACQVWTEKPAISVDEFIHQYGENVIVDLPTNFNNGGDTDYYRIDPEWIMLQDIIEDREMNFAQANILKASFTFNKGRHEASSYERELNKIIWFAERELKRIKRG